MRDLFHLGTNSIRNMCIMNKDAFSYQNKSPEKYFLTAENKKN